MNCVKVESNGLILVPEFKILPYDLKYYRTCSQNYSVCLKNCRTSRNITVLLEILPYYLKILPYVFTKLLYALILLKRKLI